MWMLVNNSLASGVPLVLMCVALAGQFQGLRVVSLTLLGSVVGGAYGSKIVLQSLQSESPVLAILAAATAGALIAVLGGLLDSQFTGRSRVLALLASIGFVRIIQGVATLRPGGSIETLAVNFRRLPDEFMFSEPAWLFPGLLLTAGCAVTQMLARKSIRWGLSAAAVGDDTFLATLFGVPTRRVLVEVTAIGGAICGVAGLFLAVDGGLRPDLGVSIALKAFGILIASSGSFWAIFVWAGLLLGLEQIVGYSFGGQLREVAGLGFLVSALLLVGRRSIADPTRTGDTDLQE